MRYFQFSVWIFCCFLGVGLASFSRAFDDMPPSEAFDSELERLLESELLLEDELLPEDELVPEDELADDEVLEPPRLDLEDTDNLDIPPPLDLSESKDLDRPSLPLPEEAKKTEFLSEEGLSGEASSGERSNESVGDNPITLLLTDSYVEDPLDADMSGAPPLEVVTDREPESRAEGLTEENYGEKVMSQEEAIEAFLPEPLRVPAPGMEFWVMDMILGRLPIGPISMSLLAFAALVLPWAQGRRRATGR